MSMKWMWILTLGILMLCGCSGLRGTYEKEVGDLSRAQGTIRPEKLSGEDLAKLPEPLRKCIQNSGFLKNDRIRFFHAVYRGSIRLSPGQKPIPIECEQVNSVDLSTRIWYGKARMAPLIYFEARHIYTPTNAQMLVKFGPFTLVDQSGPRMLQADMVTCFNDIVLFMPTAMLNPDIRWTGVDARTVKGTYERDGRKASAFLYFNDQYEVTNFISDDRFALEGTNLVGRRWETPIDSYRIRDGLKEAVRGTALWRLPEGEYTYFYIDDPEMKVEYNRLP